MNKTRRIIAATAIGAVLLGGGVATAAAVTSDDGKDVPITGSVTAPVEDDTQTDAAEDAALEALATISADEAVEAALAAVPGTAGVPEIDDEDGFVVYDIDVRTADGVVEVTVDAGDGTVLQQERDDDADDTDDTDDANDDANNDANNDANDDANDD